MSHRRAKILFYLIIGAGVVLIIQASSTVSAAVALLGWSAVYFVMRYVAVRHTWREDESVLRDSPPPVAPHAVLQHLAIKVHRNPWLWVVVIVGWIACLAVVVWSLDAAGLFVAIMLAAWGGGIYVSAIPDSPRGRSMRAAAERLGLAFQACPCHEDLKTQPWKEGLRILEQHHCSYALYWIHGEWRGLQVSIFDFFCLGDQYEDDPRTAVTLESDAIDLPHFVLQPRGRIGRWAAMMRVGGACLPWELDRRYRVEGLDTEFASLFSSGVVAILRDHPDWVIEAGDRRLAVYRKGKCLAPDEVAGFLDEALELVAQLCGGRHADDRPLAVPAQAEVALSV